MHNSGKQLILLLVRYHKAHTCASAKGGVCPSMGMAGVSDSFYL